MSFNSTSFNKNLSKRNPFFGIKLWVLFLAFIAIFSVLVLLIMILCIIYFVRQKSKSSKPHFRLPYPISCNVYRDVHSTSSLDRGLLSRRISEIEMNIARLYHRHSASSPAEASAITTPGSDLESVARHSPVVSDAWRGNRFALREVEVVTNGFEDENLIGNGEHGVVYRGILLDTTRVAVKRLFSKSCQSDDFIAEVEMIGNVRHKNLVKLLGYCMEGGYRMLISEYVDNGNLHQWLHGWHQPVSPLTWSVRVSIIQGIAKGLAYLHEDIEPMIVHRGLKSSNVLLDHQWNPKISDFGIAKLFGPEWNLSIAQSMEVNGYLSREYASAGVLNKRTDVYSFGILIMEIISGRTPFDCSQPQEYLVEWLGSMVANQKVMYVLDPKLPEMPSSKELKRMLLLALRCVDPDKKHRPTMADVIHMLEPRDLLLNDEPRMRRNASSRRNHQQPRLNAAESG